MTSTLFSPSWYRVAGLKPALRRNAPIYRHEYRGQAWYILQERSSDRFHRFTPATYYIIGLMNGERTVDEIWNAAVRKLGDFAPSQDETIRLLAQLYAANILHSDALPDMRELFGRHRRMEWMRIKQKIGYPLAIRIPLIDPDRFLDLTAPIVRPMFTWFGFVLWLMVVGAGVAVAVIHWPELTENVADRVLTPYSLLTLWIAYPLVKTLHEFGHAYAVKVWGGEVREMGVMFLVFVPVPYVDASAASGFHSKWRRMVVDGAGIMVELLLAALALFLWVLVQPGLIHTFLYSVILIGGVSTVLFNGNPLLRFDGHYLLSDAIEIPNLGTRSRSYLAYLAKRWVLGVRGASFPESAAGERLWLFLFGVASFVYRMSIIAAIALFVATKFMLVGVLIAIWALMGQVVVPLLKGVGTLLTGRSLHGRRGRAIFGALTVVAGLSALLLAVPLPRTTVAQGVVWVPDRGEVRPGADGFVVDILAVPGESVVPGTPLVQLGDPLLIAEVRDREAEYEVLSTRLMAVEFADPVEAAILREEIAAAREDLASYRERSAEQVVRSRDHGVFILPNAEDLEGRYVKRGSLIGYVVRRDAINLRVVLDQTSIGPVRENTKAVEVWPADYSGKKYGASILREVPAGSNTLPSRALTVEGGGPFPLDPRADGELRTLERVFQLELRPERPVDESFLGQRVHVRFVHDGQPLGHRVYRSLRRLFLSRFSV